MNSPHLPIDLPKRQSLVSQAANSIEKAIHDGIWSDHLPSARHLCDIYQISRPTIRTALQILEKKGLLEIRQGRRNRLLAPSNQTKKPTGRLVGLISHEPLANMSIATIRVVSELRMHLAEHGFTTELLICPPHNTRIQQRRLSDFIRQNCVFCCILLSVTKSVQDWFSRNSVLALVLGSCHPEVNLPSLDINYRSVCRHAGGILLSKGHQHIAFVVPSAGVAGDLASEEGFIESAHAHRASGVHTTIVRHNGSAQNIRIKLDVLFSSTNPPTGLLIAKPQHVFVVIFYLLKKGMDVPNEVSIVARDYDHIFELVSPPIAHYSLKDELFSRSLLRLILKMASSGYLAPAKNLLSPRFFAGSTVKQYAGPPVAIVPKATSNT